MSDQYLPDGQSCGKQKVKKKKSHPRWTWVSVIIRSAVMGEEVSVQGDGGLGDREVEELEKFQAMEVLVLPKNVELSVCASL